jgi:phosphatidylserine decarboxylase
VTEWRYDAGKVVLKQGEEMGRFLLGSTVVLLFRKDALHFNPDWAPAKPVQLGESMGI